MPNTESFPALAAIPGICHAFTTRAPGVDVATDRETALARLAPHHAEAAESLGFSAGALCTAEQIHGGSVERAKRGESLPGADGLWTDKAGDLLGIYVADCCAVFIVDRARPAIALVHSGKKGTEAGIAPAAIRRLRDECGSRPEDLIVQLSPCIRPPLYEVDIAAEIRRTCAAEGVPAAQIHDPMTCTGQNVGRYYSYRVEMGKTGRMLALLALR